MSMENTGTVSRPAPELSVAVYEHRFDKIKPIAHKILPPVDTDTRTGTQTFALVEDMARKEENRVAPGTAYNRLGLRQERATYECEKYGNEFPITEEDYGDNIKIMNVSMAGAIRVATNAILNYEYNVARETELIYGVTPSTFTSTDLQGSDKPWTETDANIKGQLGTLYQTFSDTNYGIAPDALILSDDSWRLLKSNETMRQYFPGAPVITDNMLMDFIESEFAVQILVGRARYNADAKAATEAGGTSTPIWSNKYCGFALVGGDVRPEFDTKLGSTMRWINGTTEIMAAYSAGDFPDPDTVASLMDFRVYQEEQTDTIEVVKGRCWLDEKIWNTKLLQLGQIRATEA